MRIIDEALPADGSTRFLEIDAHHDQKVVGEFADDVFEAEGIFTGGPGVMNRAWSYDHEQTTVAAMNDIGNFRARAKNGVGGLLRERQFLFEEYRRQDHLGPFNAQIIGA